MSLSERTDWDLHWFFYKKINSLKRFFKWLLKGLPTVRYFFLTLVYMSLKLVLACINYSTFQSKFRHKLLKPHYTDNIVMLDKNLKWQISRGKLKNVKSVSVQQLICIPWTNGICSSLDFIDILRHTTVSWQW
jgi:hypothetical protein